MPNLPIPGLIQPGNIDLLNRPRVKNADGSISTVRSVGVNINGREILLPTVSDDGRIVSVQEAIDNFKKTGKHLGIFQDPDSATRFAQSLHDQQAAMIKNDQSPSLASPKKVSVPIGRPK